MLDVDALSTMIADIVSEEVGKAVKPLQDKIAELEVRPAGVPMDDVKGVVEIMISDAIVTKFVSQDTVEKLIEAEIAKLPAPEVVDLEPLSVRVEALEAVEMPDVLKGDPGEDGSSITPEDVAPMIAEEVAKAVAALPAPKDGKDAANIVEALKHEGELVLTLEDGRLIRTGIRDGKDGAPGQNGFSLDDFDMEKGEDGRTFVLKFERGEVRHEYELTFPFPVYRSVFKDGTTYVPGDIVTWGGNAWHCDKETTGKPDCGDWTLMVKKGRDGRDLLPKAVV